MAPKRRSCYCPVCGKVVAVSTTIEHPNKLTHYMNCWDHRHVVKVYGYSENDCIRLWNGLQNKKGVE